VDRAKVYDIDSERDVCKYIDIMYTFGRDFDIDPEIPWASKILNKKRQTGSFKKMDHLFKEALKQIKYKSA
jgi:hypothetical protein